MGNNMDSIRPWFLATVGNDYEEGDKTAVGLSNGSAQTTGTLQTYSFVATAATNSVEATKVVGMETCGLNNATEGSEPAP